MAVINVYEDEADKKRILAPVPYYVESAQKLVAELETYAAPWRKSQFSPINGVSGRPYHALNALNLMVEGYNDPRWLTFNQIAAAGGVVKKGEHGTKVQFWINAKWQDKTDENGEPVIGADGKPEREAIELDKPESSLTVVFNAEQCEHLPELPEFANTNEQIEERGERLIKAMGVNFANDSTNARSSYDFKSDTIHLRPREDFSTRDYYAEACYQLIKATAHKSREDRRTGVAGSVDRAMEEMRVDIGAAMLTATLGIGVQNHQVSPNMANTWRNFLTEHPAAIINVAKDAERAVQHVLNCEKELLQMQGNENAPTPPMPTIGKEERLYLRVSFDDRDKVKELGAKFDGEKKSWYVPESAANKDEFKRWHDVEFARQAGKEEGRTYLNIKKENTADKEAAKAAGAKFDNGALLWYAPVGADAQKFAQWTRSEPTAALDIREQAAKKMADIGLVCDEKHPICDGKSHRCAVVDDKQGERSGFYIIHPDGMANIYAVNNRTKESVKEKFAGVHVSRAEMQEIKATASVKVEEEKKATAVQHDKVAEWCEKKIAGLVDLERAMAEGVNGVKIDAPAYLANKKIGVHAGVFVDGKTGTLNVPMHNHSGEIRSICYINPDGSKGYTKGSEKTGNFHSIPGAQDANAVIICEGYATAATVAELVGDKAMAVMVGDSGNIKPVAEKFKKVFPNTAFVIACDDDQTVKGNPGKTHAEEAARLIGAVVATPYFSDETRAEAKAAGVEHLSDFNDMERFHSGYSPKDILLEAVDQALTQLNIKERAEAQELAKENAKEKTPEEKKLVQEKVPERGRGGMSR